MMMEKVGGGGDDGRRSSDQSCDGCVWGEVILERCDVLFIEWWCLWCCINCCDCVVERECRYVVNQEVRKRFVCGDM